MSVALAWPTPARPEPVREARTWFVTDARLLLGAADVAGLDLLVPALGFAWRLAPTLSLRASALALLAFGAPRDGRRAHGGGGELELRVSPWPDAPVSPWLHTAVGLLFFPREPFLPGGDIYEGLVTFGAGADVELVERLSLTAAVDYVHLSNGQGLGPHNPAFDGLGLSLGVRWAARLGEPLADPWGGHPDVVGARPDWAPGVAFDAHVGRVEDALLGTARVRVAQRLADPLLALLDAETGALDASALVEVGLGLVLHAGGVVSAGAHAGYRDFAGLGTPVLAFQAEVHATEALDVVALLHWERPEIDARDLWRAAIGVRAYPLRCLLVDLGVGFDRFTDPDADDRSDPYLGLEWQLPIRARDFMMSLFIERQVSTVDTVGVRFSWGLGATLRDGPRHAGWRRVR